jgi:hypothetical protein
MVFFQDNNLVVKKWGEERHEEKLYNHVDLIEMLGIADVDKGRCLTSFLGCEIAKMDLPIRTDMTLLPMRSTRSAHV